MKHATIAIGEVSHDTGVGCELADDVIHLGHLGGMQADNIQIHQADQIIGGACKIAQNTSTQKRDTALQICFPEKVSRKIGKLTQSLYGMILVADG